MKKVMILIIMLTFITGCTIKYDIRIDSNLKVKETIRITEDNDILGIYNHDLKVIPKQRIDEYKNISGFRQLKLKKEIFQNDKTGGIIEANYNSLDDYSKSGTFTSLFNSLSVNESSSVATVTISDYNYSFFEFDEEGTQIDDVEVSIRFHNKVVSSNSKSYDKKTNTYTWVLGRNSNTKSITFEIDKNTKRWDIIIQDFINENLVTIIITGIILVVAGIIALRFYIRNRNLNKI